MTQNIHLFSFNCVRKYRNYFYIQIFQGTCFFCKRKPSIENLEWNLMKFKKCKDNTQAGLVSFMPQYIMENGGMGQNCSDSEASDKSLHET